MELDEFQKASMEGRRFYQVLVEKKCLNFEEITARTTPARPGQAIYGLVEAGNEATHCMCNRSSTTGGN